MYQKKKKKKLSKSQLDALKKGREKRLKELVSKKKENDEK